jgi:hypothetical protein
LGEELGSSSIYRELVGMPSSKMRSYVVSSSEVISEEASLPIIL